MKTLVKYENVPARVYGGHNDRRLRHTSEYEKLMRLAGKHMKKGDVVTMSFELKNNAEQVKEFNRLTYGRRFNTPTPREVYEVMHLTIEEVTRE